MQPEIWDLPVPEVNIEDILRVQGVKSDARPLRSKMIELYQLILGEASTLVQPRAIRK